MAFAAALLLVLTKSASSLRPDWLIDPTPFRAAASSSDDGTELTLENGLVRRSWRLAPNAATVKFDNLVTGEPMLRAVSPEASLMIDGTRYDVGGLVGQPDLAYLLPEWLKDLKRDSRAFKFTGKRVAPIEPAMAWKRTRNSEGKAWPPSGVGIALHFEPPSGELAGVSVDVRYEMYDGIPLMAKWLVVHNDSKKTIRIDRFVGEILRVPEYESAVGAQDVWHEPNVHVFTDYSFGGDTPTNANRSVHWNPDLAYTTQVNYELKSPLLLECYPALGPADDVRPGGSFTSFRTFELLQDGNDRERCGLAIRKAYRTLAPWCTESPIMMHLTSSDETTAKNAIDQCAEVGFEMLIFSFGSGLNMEDVSPANIGKFKKLADYAHAKGIQIGGYSLLASRRIDDANDCINPKTGKPGGAIFGDSPCLGSRWGLDYFAHLQTFLTETGFDLLEHDGSYPGDVCASTAHPGHRGLEDSQWTQFQRIAQFYRWCRARGVYLNVPDWYMLSGSNKTGMGYRETNWSLPIDQQIVHARQNMYDGTWTKPPTMGWMLVPLVEYQGGGASATIEPLSEHLPQYEAHLANNFGFGVQACYRGPRLFDTEQTKSVVKSWVSKFKAHRAILESDVIHVSRAGGIDLDCIVHVNPTLPDKAFVVAFNPTDRPIRKTLSIPVYFASISRSASVRTDGLPTQRCQVSRDYRIEMLVDIPPKQSRWYSIR